MLIVGQIILLIIMFLIYIGFEKLKNSLMLFLTLIDVIKNINLNLILDLLGIIFTTLEILTVAIYCSIETIVFVNYFWIFSFIITYLVYQYKNMQHIIKRDFSLDTFILKYILYYWIVFIFSCNFNIF